MRIVLAVLLVLVMVGAVVASDRIVESENIAYGYYVVNTNFRVSQDTVDKLYDINGITGVYLRDPYSVRIDIAKLFSWDIIRRCVEDILLHNVVTMHDCECYTCTDMIDLD